MNKIFTTLILIISFGSSIISQSLNWAKKIGGNNQDAGTAVAVDASGNIYTVGYFDGTVDFDPGTGVSNMTSTNGNAFLSKLDAAGNFVWAKYLGFGNCSAIAIDASGNILITGGFNSTNDFDPGSGTFTISPTAGSVDVFITKLDINGNFLWARSIGNAYSDVSTSIAVDPSGNVYTTGYFRGTVDFDPGAGTTNLVENGGSCDIFISKLDALGNYVWAKRIGAPSFSYDYGYGIAVDALSNVYLTGSFYSGADFDPGPGTAGPSIPGGGDNIFVAKYDINGDYVWAKGMGGGGTCEGRSIALDINGNIYTTGMYRSISDFDPGSGTFNLTAIGNEDIFISKLDNNGNFVWAKGIGGTDNEKGVSIAVSSTGNVYSVGYFRNPCDFDPGAPVLTLNPAGDDEGYISILDSLGNFIYGGQIGGVDYDNCNSVAVDTSGNCLVTGSFMVTADFDTGASTFNLTAAGSRDAFILKLGNSATGILTNKKIAEPFIYPNPNNGVFTIKTNSLESCNVGVYNNMGQLVKYETGIKNNAQFNMTGYAPGIYNVVLNIDGTFTSTKVVIE